MDSSMLRLIWTVIEETRNREMETLTDKALIQQVVQQVTRRILLNPEETGAVRSYVSSRTTLIRDLSGSYRI